MFEQILEILKIVPQILTALQGILAELQKQSGLTVVLPAQPIQPATLVVGTATTGTAAEPLPAIPPKAEIPTAAPIVQTASAVNPVTREACGKALIGLGTTKGRDAAVAVLAQFKATKVAEVPEAEFGNFLAAIAKASA